LTLCDVIRRELPENGGECERVATGRLLRLHHRGWRHCGVPTGGDAVAVVSGACAGKRRRREREPQPHEPRRVLEQPLERRDGGLAGPGFHFRRGSAQRPWPCSWRQQCHQRGLLQPSPPGFLPEVGLALGPRAGEPLVPVGGEGNRVQTQPQDVAIRGSRWVARSRGHSLQRFHSGPRQGDQDRGLHFRHLWHKTHLCGSSQARSFIQHQGRRSRHRGEAASGGFHRHRSPVPRPDGGPPPRIFAGTRRGDSFRRCHWKPSASSSERDRSQTLSLFMGYPCGASPTLRWPLPLR